MAINGPCETLFPLNSISLFMAIMICFFAVLLASTANAETAWVEWEHTTRCSGEGATPKNWFLHEAFPSYEACMNAVHGSAKRACRGDVLKECTSYDTSAVYVYDKECYKSEYFCYPDTIDPRK